MFLKTLGIQPGQNPLERLALRRKITEGWPMVPDSGRIEAAMSYLTKNPAGKKRPTGKKNPDAGIISEMLEDAKYQTWTQREIQRQWESIRTDSDLYLSMMTIAMSCQSDAMIAMTVDLSGGKTKPDLNDIVFDMIPRHPDWMGMCPALGYLPGRDCIVMESSLKPDTAAIVIAIPPGGFMENNAENTPGIPTPMGAENARLNRILRHHGAGRIQWYSSGQPEQHRR